MRGINENLLARIQKLEREIERLKVKESPIMSNYLLTTGKAADSDKLDGVDSTGFATSGHDHSGVYLPVSGKAADSDKLDGVDSTDFVNTTSTQTVAGVKTFSSIPVLPSSNPTTSNQAVRKGYADATYLGITAKAADADKLDGVDSTGFATAGHDHNGVYIPLTNFAGYTGTIVGWSGSPAKQLTYVVIGKLLLMSVYIQGTSNSTTASVTIPSGLTSASQGVPQTLPVRVRDNGVLMQTPGMAILENNGTVIEFYLNYGGGGFTASGTKRVTGNFAWFIA